MPRASSAAAAHAAEAGECVYVAGIGGLLVPTLSAFGPRGDVGQRVDWTAYEAEPVPRHRLEMLDLRDVERTLVSRLREHTEAFERVGGSPWGTSARAEAEAALETRLWGLPDDTPGKALRVMSLAATAGVLAERARRLTSLGSDGLDLGTSARRESLVRSLAADADDALADATNVAVMSLAGWRRHSWAMAEQHELQPLDESSFESVLCVAAHPDDLEYGTAAAVDKWVKAGKTVTYLLVDEGRGRHRHDASGRGGSGP